MRLDDRERLGGEEMGDGEGGEEEEGEIMDGMILHLRIRNPQVRNLDSKDIDLDFGLVLWEERLPDMQQVIWEIGRMEGLQCLVGEIILEEVVGEPLHDQVHVQARVLHQRDMNQLALAQPPEDKSHRHQECMMVCGGISIIIFYKHCMYPMGISQIKIGPKCKTPLLGVSL